MVKDLCLGELKQQWELLWANFAVNCKLKEQLWQDLLSLYNQPHRHYHNLSHLQGMLKTISQVKFLASNFEAIALATWFHDCIYEPRQWDNEEKSANFAQVKLRELGLNESLIQKVKTLILSTKDHQFLPDDIDSKILLDADLEILGKPPEIYNSYAQAIRQEYIQVPPEIYAKKRGEILAQFLSKKRIYYTDFFFERWENQARINLKQEMVKLAIFED